MQRKTLGPRDRDIAEVVKALLLSEVAFQEIFKRYKGGHLRFSDISNWADDKGRSLLYKLKEQSHSLFRPMGKTHLHKKEWLLDLTIGSIFHEAMKLRENVYQLEVYQPKYQQYKKGVEKTYLRQFERIISKAQQGVTNGMVESQSLFQDAMAHLIDFSKGNAKNPFLVRFLLENQALLRRIYGSIERRISNAIVRVKKGAVQIAGCIRARET